MSGTVWKGRFSVIRKGYRWLIELGFDARVRKIECTEIKLTASKASLRATRLTGFLGMAAYGWDREEQNSQ
jgi:hypothetical protein